ncbi:MAG TPA: 2'-5' RNA ligase family protein [Acidimicrobiales bacterium]|nr:MAG: hypothetical protein B7Z69_00825 [Actinobacteria bacterium 21-73-9]HQU26156.1 2'-5' RNA ligase family protein [Acidimicrobiales bacterium]
MAPRDPAEPRPSTYLALEPPPDIRRELREAMTHLGVRDAVPHVTLVAPPEIPTGDTWTAALREVASTTAPFAVRLGGVASFDGRVRYLAVEGEGVYALRGALEAALGLAPRSEPFVAHLTLAVARRGRPLPEVADGAIPSSVHRAFLAVAVVLFARSAPGASYVGVRSYPLTGAP